MKYYLIEIADGDDKIKGKGVFEYEDRTLAIANFHAKLGVAMKSELYKSEQLIVLNSANGIEANEVYVNEKWAEPTEAEPIEAEPIE